MNFPHRRLRQESVDGLGHQLLLASAISRQANSFTAQALLRAARQGESDSHRDEIDRRIQYFSSFAVADFPPSGSFGTLRRSDSTAQATNEGSVYQNASAISKAHGAKDGWDWGTVQPDGARASRTI